MSAPLPFRFLGVSPLIPARDVEEAIVFYRDSLGFQLFYRDAEPAQFAIVGRDAARLHLFASQDKHLADWTSLRIEVDGIDALYGRCQEGGCVHSFGHDEIPKKFVMTNLFGLFHASC